MNNFRIQLGRSFKINGILPFPIIYTKTLTYWLRLEILFRWNFSWRFISLRQKLLFIRVRIFNLKHIAHVIFNQVCPLCFHINNVLCIFLTCPLIKSSTPCDDRWIRLTYKHTITTGQPRRALNYRSRLIREKCITVKTLLCSLVGSDPIVWQEQVIDWKPHLSSV